MKAFFIGGLLFCSVFLVDCSNPDRPTAKPQQPQVRKIPVYFQSAPNTCGPAALLSICEFYGIKTTEQQIATLAGTTSTGTSLYGLAQAADSLGLKAAGMELSLEELKGAKTPLIAHLNGGHFVVVVSVHKGRLTVIDPAKGVKSVALVDFLREWQGYVLLLEPTIDSLLQSQDHQCLNHQDRAESDYDDGTENRETLKPDALTGEPIDYRLCQNHQHTNCHQHSG